MSATNYSPIPVDFPFIYLHNEIVKYFQERDKAVATQQKEWLQRLKHTTNTSEILEGPGGKLMTNQIFSQVPL
jgi:hypothetical protein